MPTKHAAIKQAPMIGKINLSAAKNLNADFAAKCSADTKWGVWNYTADFKKASRGKLMLTYDEGSFKVVKVTSIGKDRAGDISVRVTDGVTTWRAPGGIILV